MSHCTKQKKLRTFQTTHMAPMTPLTIFIANPNRYGRNGVGPDVSLFIIANHTNANKKKTISITNQTLVVLHKQQSRVAKESRSLRIYIYKTK